MFGMHWLGWCIIGFILFVAWIGREIPSTDYKGRKKTLGVPEELERRE